MNPLKPVLKVISRLVGTPEDHAKEVEKHQVVTVPEFNITQYAKKLTVVVGVILPAILTALKAAKIGQFPDAVVVGALGVVAASLLGVSFVMGVDVASRAYLTASGAEPKESDPSKPSTPAAPAAPAALTNVLAMPAGSLAWLKGSDTALPVLAIAAGADKTTGAYLLAGGSVITHPGSGSGIRAFDGAPEWHDAESIESFRPAKWD